jgi:hypothetical protein
MISTGSLSANAIAKSVLPTAVGPIKKITSGSIHIFVKEMCDLIKPLIITKNLPWER